MTEVKLNDLYFGHSKFPSFSMSIFVICFGATGGDSSEETTIDGVILDFLFISCAIFNFSFVTGYFNFSGLLILSSTTPKYDSRKYRTDTFFVHDENTKLF